MTVLVAELPAKLYALSIALDAVADRVDAGLPADHDVDLLIAQGRLLMQSANERGEKVSGPGVIYMLDAAATFLRAWARHADAHKAVELIDWTEFLESCRETALALGAPVGRDKLARGGTRGSRVRGPEPGR